MPFLIISHSWSDRLRLCHQRCFLETTGITQSTKAFVRNNAQARAQNVPSSSFAGVRPFGPVGAGMGLIIVRGIHADRVFLKLGKETVSPMTARHAGPPCQICPTTFRLLRNRAACDLAGSSGACLKETRTI